MMKKSSTTNDGGVCRAAFDLSFIIYGGGGGFV